MSKGPSGTTTVEQQQNNPTADAQRPYLTAGWDTASNLAGSDPYQYYPGQTLANYNPAIGAAYQGEINAALDLPSITNAANGVFGNIANGAYGVGNSPAYAQLASILGGTSPIQSTLLQNAGDLGNVGEAAAGAGGTYGNELSSLGQSAAADKSGARLIFRGGLPRSRCVRTAEPGDFWRTQQLACRSRGTSLKRGKGAADIRQRGGGFARRRGTSTIGV